MLRSKLFAVLNGFAWFYKIGSKDNLFGVCGLFIISISLFMRVNVNGFNYQHKCCWTQAIAFIEICLIPCNSRNFPRTIVFFKILITERNVAIYVYSKIDKPRAQGCFSKAINATYPGPAIL